MSQVAYELRYPIGEFDRPQKITSTHLQEWIKLIEDFPGSLKSEIASLRKDELSWIYRPEGWSIQQLVHHCADSHMNAFTRFKLALTEEVPTIRPYYEDRWARLPDTTEVPVEVSLELLKNLHFRWVHLLKSLSEDDLKRTYLHPEYGQEFPLDDVIGQYAWHCEHHLAHVKQAKSAKGSYN